MDNRIEADRLRPKTAEKKDLDSARRPPEKITRAVPTDQSLRRAGKYCKISNFHICVTWAYVRLSFSIESAAEQRRFLHLEPGDEGFSNFDCG
jgi:hypothetical protein